MYSQQQCWLVKPSRETSSTQHSSFEDWRVALLWQQHNQSWALISDGLIDTALYHEYIIQLLMLRVISLHRSSVGWQTKCCQMYISSKLLVCPFYICCLFS